MAVPSAVVPARKSTRTTLPSLSVALAVMVMSAPSAKLAPLVGLEMLTAGSMFGGGRPIAPSTFRLSRKPMTSPVSTSEPQTAKKPNR